jgi:predicted esterase
MITEMIRNALLGFILTLIFSSQLCLGSEPTHKDVEYSQQNARCKLDVWLPKGTKKPCPIVVYFHGGGFTGGDKAKFRRHRILRKYLDKGIAFASVNYPLLEKEDTLDRVAADNPIDLAAAYLTKGPSYLHIKAQAAESIRFLKTQNEEWNIDPARIAVMGTSAGAMIAEYLTYWEDLGITGCFAEQQPYYSLYLLTAVKKGDPPLILYTRAGANNKVHNPRYARKFKKYFDTVGVKCELYGSKASGLPQLPAGLAIEERVMQLFSNQWGKHVKENNAIKHNEENSTDGLQPPQI